MTRFEIVARKAVENMVFGPSIDSPGEPLLDIDPKNFSSKRSDITVLTTNVGTGGLCALDPLGSCWAICFPFLVGRFVRAELVNVVTVTTESATHFLARC